MNTLQPIIYPVRKRQETPPDIWLQFHRIPVIIKNNLSGYGNPVALRLNFSTDDGRILIRPEKERWFTNGFSFDVPFQKDFILEDYRQAFRTLASQFLNAEWCYDCMEEGDDSEESLTTYFRKQVESFILEIDRGEDPISHVYNFSFGFVLEKKDSELEEIRDTVAKKESMEPFPDYPITLITGQQISQRDPLYNPSVDQVEEILKDGENWNLAIEFSGYDFDQYIYSPHTQDYRSLVQFQYNLKKVKSSNELNKLIRGTITDVLTRSILPLYRTDSLERNQGKKFRDELYNCIQVLVMYQERKAIPRFISDWVQWGFVPVLPV